MILKFLFSIFSAVTKRTSLSPAPLSFYWGRSRANCRRGARLAVRFEFFERRPPLRGPCFYLQHPILFCLIALDPTPWFFAIEIYVPFPNLPDFRTREIRGICNRQKRFRVLIFFYRFFEKLWRRKLPLVNISGVEIPHIGGRDRPIVPWKGSWARLPFSLTISVFRADIVATFILRALYLVVFLRNCSF